MVNASPYIRTIIDWNGMDKDWGHAYMLVSQRPYKGKPGAGLAPRTGSATSASTTPTARP